MLWQKVDQRWLSRVPKDREGDVSWTKEQWAAPGEDPLEVRVCKRDGVPGTLKLIGRLLREPSFPAEEFEVLKRQALRNCVDPVIGLHVLNAALKPTLLGRAA